MHCPGRFLKVVDTPDHLTVATPESEVKCETLSESTISVVDTLEDISEGENFVSERLEMRQRCLCKEAQAV